MIALDTNILLRLVTHDDPAQLAAIARFFKAHDGETFFVADSVLVETVWSLRSAFGWDRSQIASSLRQLAVKPDVEFEERDHFMAALKALEAGGDFADALLVAKARERNCASVASFDGDLAKRHPDFVLVPK